MKSQVKLYYSTNEKPFKLMSSKLFIVEDFENYLATFTPLILNDFQYIKDESMQISIKIIANESNIDLLKENRWKYCSIQNEDTNYPRYYFINNIEWVSQGACVLSLLLDVLNTFRIGRDYSFNARTNILREHRNRFEVGKQRRTLEALPYAALMMKWHNEWVYFLQNIVDNPITRLTFTKPVDSQVKSYDLWLLDTDELEIHDHYKFDKIIFIEDSSEIEFYLNDELVFTGRSGEQYTSGYIMAIRSEYMEGQDSEGGVPDYKQKIARMSSGIIKYSNNIYRIIDKNSEDINPVLFKQNNDEVIYDDNSVGTSWNLVYRNQNNPTPEDASNPVDCFLIPENDCEIVGATPSTTGTINPSDLESGSAYFINPWQLQVDMSAFKNGDDNTPFTTMNDNVMLRLRKVNNQIEVILLQYSNFIPQQPVETTFMCNSVIVDAPSFRYGKHPEATYYEYLLFNQIPVELYSGYLWIFQSTGTLTLSSINNIDKTDAKLIKIIKLPYIPDDIPVVNGVLQISSAYEISTISGHNYLKLKDLNYKWLNHIDTEQISPIEKVFNIGDTIFQTEDYESKMYNSEFYINKYVYDSFALPIIMENVDYNKFKVENPSGVMNINFYTTSTINSRFAFEFAEYTCSRGDNDYYKWLTIARNNEAVLYNVAYINYIRSGFNYDVKNKNVSTAMSWIGFGAGVIGTIGAFASAIYSGGIAIPLAIGMATTTATSLANAINITTKNERDMEQKLNQLKEQSANVRGSDDFDLMYRYNGNKLLLMEYKPSEAMQALLKKTFYYLGYKCNKYAIPETNTRESFNYLACNPVFNIFSKNLTSEIENQLELLYKNGVTFIHKRLLDWDLEQTSENLETDMRAFMLANII